MHVWMTSSTVNCANDRILTRLSWNNIYNYVICCGHGNWNIHQAFDKETVLVERSILLENCMNMERDIIANMYHYGCCTRVNCSIEHERPLLSYNIEREVLRYMRRAHLCRKNVELV